MGSGHAEHDPYARLPELYDLEHAGFDEDIALYLQFAEVIGDPILELGCGTGRVLRPLANAGWRVTGLDQSAPMLDRARASLRESGMLDRATLFLDSMAAADQAPGGPFGLAIFSLNGLMHLPTVAEQRAALQAARNALDPRGMVIIDVQNPTPDWMASFDGRVSHEGTWRQDDGRMVSRFSSRTHGPAHQLLETNLWYDTVDVRGCMSRVQTRFPMRYLYRSELEPMLELAGFVEWQVYGSYELDPFDDGSERLIMTAEVTPS